MKEQNSTSTRVWKRQKGESRTSLMSLRNILRPQKPYLQKMNRRYLASSYSIWQIFSPNTYRLSGRQLHHRRHHQQVCQLQQVSLYLNWKHIRARTMSCAVSTSAHIVAHCTLILSVMLVKSLPSHHSSILMHRLDQFVSLCQSIQAL